MTMTMTMTMMMMMMMMMMKRRRRRRRRRRSQRLRCVRDGTQPRTVVVIGLGRRRGRADTALAVDVQVGNEVAHHHSDL
jgi:preprotein translocase subunit YajC